MSTSSALPITLENCPDCDVQPGQLSQSRLRLRALSTLRRPASDVPGYRRLSGVEL